MRNLFILAFLTSFFLSCTIEKRLHSKGYHVEWNSKNKVSKSKIQEKLSPQEDIIHNEDLTIQEEINQEISSTENSSESIDDNLFLIESDEDLKKAKEKNQIFNNIELEIKENRTISFLNDKIYTSKKVKHHQKKNRDERTVNVAAIVSLILGVIGLVLVFFAPIVNFIFSIPAIVFAIRGLIKSSENPDLGGRGMSITGLILGCLGIILGIALLALIIFVLGNG